MIALGFCFMSVPCAMPIRFSMELGPSTKNPALSHRKIGAYVWSVGSAASVSLEARLREYDVSLSMFARVKLCMS